MSDSEKKAPPKKKTPEVRREIRKPDGELVVVHLSKGSSPKKPPKWEQSNGEPGLGKLHLKELPLYGIHDIPPEGPVILLEGVEAVDALKKKGIVAVGTLTDPGMCPSRDVLESLQGRKVTLCPNNNDQSTKNMERIGALLLHLEGPVHWLDNWTKKVDAQEIQNAPLWNLPERPPLASLLDEIENFISIYVNLEAYQRVAITLWVAHTWVFDCFDTTPYLIITSPEKRCGKSRLLEVLEYLVFNPQRVAHTSAAALFRSIEKEGPTLLFDELDAVFSKHSSGNEDLRGLLNAGYRRGADITRCAGDTFEVAKYSTYCPKALAAIKDLPDTIQDRGIPIRMKRMLRDTKVKRFRMRPVRKEVQPIQEKLSDWSRFTVIDLEKTPPELPEELNDRAQDGWEPLLALAELAGPEWTRRAHNAAIDLHTKEARTENETRGITLLGDIEKIFDTACAKHREQLCDYTCDRPSRYRRLPSKMLVEKLAKLPESESGALTARSLAGLLKEFGIKSKQYRDEGGNNTRGYKKDDFKDAFARYLEDLAPQSATSATTPEKQQVSPENKALPRNAGSGLKTEEKTTNPVL